MHIKIWRKYIFGFYILGSFPFWSILFYFIAFSP